MNEHRVTLISVEPHETCMPVVIYADNITVDDALRRAGTLAANMMRDNWEAAYIAGEPVIKMTKGNRVCWIAWVASVDSVHGKEPRYASA